MMISERKLENKLPMSLMMKFFKIRKSNLLKSFYQKHKKAFTK